MSAAKTVVDANALLAELNRLQAENDRLKAASQRPVTLKVSEKGALSIYGMGRFPVTLYAQQWEKLLDMQGKIREFIAANNGKLTRKEA